MPYTWPIFCTQIRHNSRSTFQMRFEPVERPIGPEIRRVEDRDDEVAAGGGRPVRQAAGDRFITDAQVGFPACPGGPGGRDCPGQHEPAVRERPGDYPLRVYPGDHVFAWYE